MNYMKFKIGGNYANLTLMECIEHWGKESGRRMFNIINRFLALPLSFSSPSRSVDIAVWSRRSRTLAQRSTTLALCTGRTNA